MIRIEEQKHGRESYFIVSEILNNQIVTKRIVDCHVASVVPHKGSQTYYLLYDSECRLNEDVYRFENENVKRRADNTRYIGLYNLRFLFSYSEIIQKPVNEFTNDNFIQFIYFLLGSSVEGEQFDYELLTKRSPVSVKLMFSTYREFYRFMGWYDSPLLMKGSYYAGVTRNQITGILKTPSKRAEVPKYISKQKYDEILEWIQKNIEDDERGRNSQPEVRAL